MWLQAEWHQPTDFLSMGTFTSWMTDFTLSSSVFKAQLEFKWQHKIVTVSNYKEPNCERSQNPLQHMPHCEGICSIANVSGFCQKLSKPIVAIGKTDETLERCFCCTELQRCTFYKYFFSQRLKTSFFFHNMPDFCSTLNIFKAYQVFCRVYFVLLKTGFMLTR